MTHNVKITATVNLFYSFFAFSIIPSLSSDGFIRPTPEYLYL